MDKVKLLGAYCVWVNREMRILSFSRLDGYEMVRFPTRRDMLLFAAEKGNEGFAIR